MTARIANGGYAVKPRLVRRITDEANDEGTPVFPSLELSPEHLKVLRTGEGRGISRRPVIAQIRVRAADVDRERGHPEQNRDEQGK